MGACSQNRIGRTSIDWFAFGGDQHRFHSFAARVLQDAEGRGLLPAPLGAETVLPAALDPSEADLVLSNHPIFSFFQSETNPLIQGSGRMTR